MARRFYIYPSVLKPHLATMRMGQRHWPLIIGKHGVSIFKREGDGKTPQKKLKLINAFHRMDRQKHFNLKAIKSKAIKAHFGWCDEVSHRRYNQPVTLPFSQSHEHLMREDCRYDYIGVLDYNIKPSKKNLGSAIFLHICPDFQAGTEGCLALKEKDFKTLIPFLSKNAEFIIVS